MSCCSFPWSAMGGARHHVICMFACLHVWGNYYYISRRVAIEFCIEHWTTIIYIYREREREIHICIYIYIYIYMTNYEYSTRGY